MIEAFERQGKDITKATPQEMRSLVCAQCHVEYYFKGDGKYLTFPWDKGFTVEDMEAYYDEAGFYDYIHKLSRTPILKAQHPDFEIAQMGIHGQRGVSCGLRCGISRWLFPRTARNPACLVSWVG